MTAVSAPIFATWIAPFETPVALQVSPQFRLAIDASIEPDAMAQILYRGDQTFALIAPVLSENPAVRDARDEESLRAALAASGIEMNGPDFLHFLPEGKKARLSVTPNPSHIRLLTDQDAELFAKFANSCPADDFEEAFVELQHWAVYGAFDDGRIVAAGSAYPYDEITSLADLGVVTLPSHRGRGLGRDVIHALARHAIERGFEPQYRCQIDNAPSVTLAARSGFERFASWDVSVPEADNPLSTSSAKH